MGFILIAALILIVSLVLFNKKDDNYNSPSTQKEYGSDYKIWFDIFRDEKSNIMEFDLFGTKAAIA